MKGGGNDDVAVRASLMLWLSVVLVPAGIFVFGLIYLVTPPSRPPSQSWANGIYVHPCCAPLLLRDGVLRTGGTATRYTVSESKFGYQIDVPAGIGMRKGRVELGGTLVSVHFNRDSMATPALRKAESMHILDLDDGSDHLFVRQE
jgi:hypothetical protein